MFRDAEQEPDGATIDAEVCVVGAGPVGIALAIELGARGIAVCLVESGGLQPGPAPTDVAEGRSIGESYFRLADTAAGGLGGTSARWFAAAGFRARPLDPIDFAVRASIPWSGWPFGREVLDPHYARAQVLLGLGPHAYELDDWAGVLHGRLAALDPARLHTVLFQVIPGTGVAHHVPALRRSTTTTVLHHAHVSRLRTDREGTRVTGLEVRTPGGRVLHVRAQRYVLAAGGLATARLLLASDDAHPAGIGNGTDQVGRFFMEHLGLRGGVVELADPEGLDGMALYRGLEVGTCQLRGKLSLPPPVLEAEGLLNATFFLEPMPPDRVTQAVRSAVILRRALRWQPRPDHLGTHLRSVLADLPAVARTAVHPHARPGGPVAFQLMAMAEQAPNPASRVTLGPSRDRLGRRRLQLDWQLTELDRRSIIRGEQLVGEALRAAGVGRLVAPLDAPEVRWQISGQWHQLGTTRMHVDPAQGVVDADARVHGVANLWVAGGSVFPTGGYANPTLTAVALAVRLATHLVGGDQHERVGAEAMA